MRRGSLKQVLLWMQSSFAHDKDQMLSIIHCPRGKYYSLLTEEELLDYNNRDKSDEMRLVARLTNRELGQFHKHIEADLFLKETDAERKTDY